MATEKSFKRQQVEKQIKDAQHVEFLCG